MEDGSDLTRRFHNLAAKFRAISSHNAKNAGKLVFRLGMQGAMLVKEAVDDGVEITNVDFPWPESLPNQMMTEGENAQWLAAWMSTCDRMAYCYPDQILQNVNDWRIVQVSDPVGAERISYGGINPENWEVRAENYAEVCEFLASYVLEQKSTNVVCEPAKPTRKRQWTVERAEKPVKRHLSTNSTLSANAIVKLIGANGPSKGTVTKTKAWKKNMKKRDSQPKTKRAVTLTKAIEETVGKDDNSVHGLLGQSALRTAPGRPVLR